MKKFLALVALLATPFVTYGAVFDLGNTFDSIENVINQLIPFIIGIAVFIFIVGLLRYVNAGGDEDKIKAARQTIIWGLIIIFVMFSAVGLVNLVNNTFQLDNQLDSSNAPVINF